MKATTRQMIGLVVLSTGILTVINSFEFHGVGPFWLGGIVTTAGVLLAVLGWKMFSRGRNDLALDEARHNDEQLAIRRARPASEDPDAQDQQDGHKDPPDEETSSADSSGTR